MDTSLYPERLSWRSLAHNNPLVTKIHGRCLHFLAYGAVGLAVMVVVLIPLLPIALISRLVLNDNAGPSHQTLGWVAMTGGSVVAYMLYIYGFKVWILEAMRRQFRHTLDASERTNADLFAEIDRDVSTYLNSFDRPNQLPLGLAEPCPTSGKLAAFR